MMHVLQYMKHTSGLGITHSNVRTNNNTHLCDSLVAYTDADWGGNQD